ncbi:hypothetical protein [Novosphingobium sp. AP12]|uniref:hypothetical protein n=1 Tax=Novosphingobium sp. AP12 TaxID=1144305 RepID=UPI001EE683AA|nr:hypothetical protein [Novosphingobium sp. AP12]
MQDVIGGATCVNPRKSAERGRLIRRARAISLLGDQGFNPAVAARKHRLSFRAQSQFRHGATMAACPFRNG